MDMSRSIKRLALILILAIFVILVSKSLLTRTVKNLSLEAKKKQLIKTGKNSAALPVPAAGVAPANADANTGALTLESKSTPSQ